MEHTINLDLPYIMPNQAQKHVTHNESLAMLDALIQLAVLDRGLSTPPTTPDEGARYIVSTVASGAWAGHEHHIASFYDGSWTFLPPNPGFLAWVIDEGRLVAWTGSAWTPASEAITELQNLTLLGLGTVADATNPFSAKVNKALWTAKTVGEGGDGDLRYTMNKEAAADVLSLLMQTGFSGRAELGLIGDDNLRLKVSADGSAWNDALSVDRTTGKVSATGLAGTVDIQTFTANGTWTKPAGAKMVHVRCTGGGGGGGGGPKVAASTACSGGGGGGGAASLERWLIASALSASVNVTVGSGGSGGGGATSAGAGSNGSAGGTTIFGANIANAVCAALGGGGGSGGSAGTNSAGGGGGGRAQAGGNASGATAGAAGGAGGIVGAAGGANGGLQANDFGGGGGGGCTGNGTGAATAGGQSAHTGHGGASGAGFSTGNTSLAGATPLNTYGTNNSPDAGGGAAPGGNGANGGSGASSTGTNGGNGGSGTSAGRGGGGGGASQSGNGGSGGAGGNGEVVVITYF